jgi:hypothetical protein
VAQLAADGHHQALGLQHLDGHQHRNLRWVGEML